MKIKLPYIIILILIIVIILQRSCKSIPSNSEPIVTIETKYDTIEKEVPVYIPKWHTKIETKTDTLTKIDTVEVLGDYFSTYIYMDSIFNDSLKLYINDSISQNKIKSRQVNYSLIYPTTTIIKEYPIQKRELYYGLGIAGNSNSINSFGPKLLYKTKQGTSYGLGIGVNGDLKPIIGIDLYWKIGKNE